ncbi:MAG: phosphate acyltransferase, partial [Candidatus Zophobacter franzmannii]|nr:phosphate acyltransferase [Candidatus Zophobacter franzmannii]
MIRNFDEMLAQVKKLSGKKVIIAGAQTPSALEAAVLAKQEGLADSILIGDKAVILDILKKDFPNFVDSFEIVDTGSDLKKACEETVRYAKEGLGDIILKGKADTALLLK